MADVLRERGIQVGRQGGIRWMQDLVLDGVRERFHDAAGEAQARVRKMRTVEARRRPNGHPWHPPLRRDSRHGWRWDRTGGPLPRGNV